MSRRTRVSLLLCGLLAWSIIDVLCGAVRMPLAMECEPVAAADCCEQTPESARCPVETCGLTCATLLTAFPSDNAVAVAPRVIAQVFVLADEQAATMREPPPVPPPRV